MSAIVIGDAIAQRLAQNLNLAFIPVEERVFPDGEVQPRLEKEISNNKVILLLQKKQEENVNSYLVKYFLLSRKIKESSSQLIAIMPYLPYARQDEIFRPGEPLSSLYIDELIERNADIFLTCNMHEHRKKIAQLFKIPAYDVFLFHNLAEKFSDFPPEKTVVVGPDGESKAFVDDFCSRFPAQKLVFHKERNVSTGEIRFILPPGLKKEDYQGKDFIIVDDIVSTGKTILGAREISQRLKAKTISFTFIHPIFGDKTIAQLQKVNPRRIVCPNTLENSVSSVDISGPLATFIKEHGII